jgi:hypothetical protein
MTQKFDIDAAETNDGIKTIAAPRTWLDAGNPPDWILPVRFTGDGVNLTLNAEQSTITVPAETTLNPSNVTDEMIQLLKDIHSEVATSDISNPDTLSFGTMDAGFFGIVPASDFITGDALASTVGVTQGTSQFSDTNWLKFAFQGEIYMIPQKPIRHTISWDHLYLQGAVYGDGLLAGEAGAEHHNLTSSSGTALTATRQDAAVTVNGLRYEVALLKGGASDPLNSYNDSDRGSLGSANEWNALMLPIHEKAVANNWNYPAYVPTVNSWDINFSDGDLLAHNKFGNGSLTWCQESSDADPAQRVHRGYGGVSLLFANDSAYVNNYRGWRPRLKLART